MSQQGRHGEVYFESLCQNPNSKIDAVINRSQNDLHGWDHVIDITPLNVEHNLPHDLRDHLYQSFVQIKTTRQKYPTTSVKLSNALKSAKSSFPTFVFLLHYIKGRDTPVIYGKHIWLYEIEDTLRRAREAESLSKAINKIIVPIKYASSDVIKVSPAEWMHEKIISCGGSNYAAEKLKIIQTVGYEGTGKVGTFNLSVPKLDDLVSFELGITKELPFEDFVLFDERFGIKSKNPIEKVDKGFVSILPEGRNVTMQISDGGDNNIKFPALAYTPISVKPGDCSYRIRVAAGFIKILTEPNSGKSKFNIKWDSHERIYFYQQKGFLSYLSWSQGKPVQIKLSHDYGNLFTGFVNKSTDSLTWPSQYLNICNYIEFLIDNERLKDLKLSLTEISDIANHIHKMSQMWSAGAIRYDISLYEALDPFKSIVGYTYGKVGDIIFGAIHTFDVRLVSVEGNKYSYYLYPPKTFDKFCYTHSNKEANEIAKNHLDSYLRNVDYPYALMEDGNLNLWLNQEGGSTLVSVRSPDEGDFEDLDIEK